MKIGKVYRNTENGAIVRIINYSPIRSPYALVDILDWGSASLWHIDGDQNVLFEHQMSDYELLEYYDSPLYQALNG